MTIYRKGTKKYKIANQTYSKNHKKKRMTKYGRLKSNITKWFYHKMGKI